MPARGPYPLGRPATATNHVIANDTTEPISKPSPGRIVLEDVAPLEHGQHHLLHDLFGRVFAAPATPGVSVNQPPVSLEEFVTGQRIGRIP
jgi:hypothetical protein